MSPLLTDAKFIFEVTPVAAGRGTGPAGNVTSTVTPTKPAVANCVEIAPSRAVSRSA